MSYLAQLDLTTRRSFRAVILCLLGTVLGTGLMLLLASSNSFLSLLGAPLLLTIFGLLVVDWSLRRGKPIYDPGATFLSYILGLGLTKLFITHFFINPSAGPFAEDCWTIPNVLAHVAFGFSVPVLIGATLGLTYLTARATTRRSPWTKGLLYLTVILAPLLFLLTFEAMLSSL